jgi:hypothetical protein
MDDRPASSVNGWPAWPLALLAGLLPFVGTVVAYTLSVRLGLIESCNPFFDGCVSISRAARHDLPNHLFRALLLPAAALQALCWILCGAWLRTLGIAATRKLRALPWVGVAAAVFLVLYGTFLGTEGDAYRWMRRYGVIVYFAGTCVAMLIVSEAARGRWLLALCAALPLLGLVSAFGPLFHVSEASRSALQNSMEWFGGLIFTLFFFAIAWQWRVSRFEVRFGLGDTEPARDP